MEEKNKIIDYKVKPICPVGKSEPDNFFKKAVSVREWGVLLMELFNKSTFGLPEKTNVMAAMEQIAYNIL